jgi:Rap1a immunity proteins
MRVAALVVISVLLACQSMASAADGPLSRVDHFLAFCKSHMQACEDEVAEVNLGMEFAYMPGTQYCPPRRMDWKIEERSVVGWLSAHPNLRDQPAPYGIRAALLAINGCS